MKKEKRSPINTTKAALEGGEDIIVSALVLGSSGAILHQEAQGQHQLVNSDTLPTAMGRFCDYDAKAILEAAGVKFLGELVEDDPMFQYVELPKGWKKMATDHSMWSKLVDDKGRERAGIFYKAAFYDRSARMNLKTRFGYRQDYDAERNGGVVVVHIADCDKVIHTTKPIRLPEDSEKKYAIQDEAVASAKNWLKIHYPNWQNPGAYWD